jgi:hypothetical protein
MKMKLNKILISFAVLTSLFITSCISDLDPESLGDRVTDATNVYKTVDDYKKGLAKLYATFALSGQNGPAGNPDIAGIDEGFGNYLRQLWSCQELTTDEALIGWNDGTIKDLHYQQWTPTNEFVGALYSRIMYTVTLCNEFIRVSAGSSDADIQTFHAEARFLRALAYYHGIDMFANVPFVTEADKPGAFFPNQTNRDDLFDYIESELIAIEDEMGAPRFEYGRADKAALWMLQAKLYLNAEVYITQTKYTEALTALNKVLAAGYTLATDYRQNFVADNHTSPELIFSINYDHENTQSFGGMVFLVHAPVGGSMPVADMFGIDFGWGGIRTTKALVNKFAPADDRGLFWTDGQDLEIEDVGLFTDGYGITKFRNRNLDGTAVREGSQPTFVDTDYPMFRLADAYLMYAEAVKRGGTGGSEAQALTYVNQLRQRAYGDNSGDITLGLLTTEFILEERARELYWEGHRRTDLIRYGKFTTGDYHWPWKGNNIDGIATEAFRNIFPIPAADLGANPKLEQNPGYN